VPTPASSRNQHLNLLVQKFFSPVPEQRFRLSIHQHYRAVSIHYHHRVGSGLQQTSKLHLRPLAHGDISGAPYELDQSSRGIQDRVAKDVDKPDSTAGEKSAVFDFVVRLLNNRPLNAALPLFAIFGMNTLQPLFPSWHAVFEVETMDPAPFVRYMQELSSSHLPDPASRMGKPLHLCQMILTSCQGFLSTPARRAFIGLP
jgi:hypothetical protein